MTNPIPVIVAEAESFWAQFKTPAGAIAALTGVVAVLGEVGILSAPLTGSLQTLLSAILGVITVAGAGAAARSAATRTALKANAAAKSARINPAV